MEKIKKGWKENEKIVKRMRGKARKNQTEEEIEENEKLRRENERNRMSKKRKQLREEEENRQRNLQNRAASNVVAVPLHNEAARPAQEEQVNQEREAEEGLSVFVFLVNKTVLTSLH